MLCKQKNKLKLNSLYQWNIYRHYKYHADIITDKGNDQSTHKSSIKCVIVQNNIDRFKKFIPVTIKLFNSDVKLENNIFQAFLWEKKKNATVIDSPFRSVSCFKNKLARFWSICPTRLFEKGWIIYYHASKNTRNVYKHQSRVSKIYVYDCTWICPRTLEESQANRWPDKG